jgi:hypothetical protein
LAEYAWQDEFRLVFSTTGALAFQNVAMKLVPDGAPQVAPSSDHTFFDAATSSLRDLCVFHRKESTDSQRVRSRA